MINLLPAIYPLIPPINAILYTPYPGPTEAPQLIPPTVACPGPFLGYSRCEGKITYAIEERPDSWFTARGLTRDRCSVQGYWATQGECPAISTTVPTKVPTEAPQPTHPPMSECTTSCLWDRCETGTPSKYDCTGPFDAATYPTCEQKIVYALNERPDQWFILRGLSTSPRDRCEVQEYWAGSTGECPSIPTAVPTAIPTASHSIPTVPGITCEPGTYCFTESYG